MYETSTNRENKTTDDVLFEYKWTMTIYCVGFYKQLAKTINRLVHTPIFLSLVLVSCSCFVHFIAHSAWSFAINRPRVRFFPIAPSTRVVNAKMPWRLKTIAIVKKQSAFEAMKSDNQRTKTALKNPLCQLTYITRDEIENITYDLNKRKSGGQVENRT